MAAHGGGGGGDWWRWFGVFLKQASCTFGTCTSRSTSWCNKLKVSEKFSGDRKLAGWVAGGGWVTGEERQDRGERDYLCVCF